MLHELNGDHNQTLKLATVNQHILMQDKEKLIAGDTDSAQAVTSALSMPGNEKALLELNNVVQNTMLEAVSCMYGTFCSPNSAVISNSTLTGLIG